MEKKIIKINSAKCKKCGLCSQVCCKDIIYQDTYEIDTCECTFCHHCYSVCPEHAIEINYRETVLKDLSFPAPEQFINLLKKRRSHRNYKQQEIPEDIMIRLLDTVRYSPTANNRQMVYVTVVTQDKLVNLCHEIYSFYHNITKFLTKITVPFFRLFFKKGVVLRLLKIKKAIGQYKAGKNIFSYNAPAAIIYHSPVDLVSVPREECMIASAVTMLTAETLGLGTCQNGYFSNAIRRSKKIRHFLNLPEGHNVFAAILAGYPQVEYKREVLRDEVRLTILK